MPSSTIIIIIIHHPNGAILMIKMSCQRVMERVWLVNSIRGRLLGGSRVSWWERWVKGALLVVDRQIGIFKEGDYWSIKRKRHLRQIIAVELEEDVCSVGFDCKSWVYALSFNWYRMWEVSWEEEEHQPYLEAQSVDRCTGTPSAIPREFVILESWTASRTVTWSSWNSSSRSFQASGGGRSDACQPTTLEEKRGKRLGGM